MSIDTTLITADEFADIAVERDGLCELVRGEVREMTRPGARHSYVCLNIGGEIRNWAKSGGHGRTMSNDGGIVTTRDPDSVRGPDIYYLREERLPDGKLPVGWMEVAPDLCVEVLSPSDRWKDILEKVTEYLEFGVLEVWVADPDSQHLHVFRPDSEPLVLSGDDSVETPQLLGFDVPVSLFFEGC